MKLSDLRDQMEQQLQDRRKESAATNEGGRKFGTIIKPELNITEWKCKEGDHLIDIIPYVTGKNNPEQIPENMVSDHVTYYVHKNVGPADAMYVCPQDNFRKPCPICEHSKALKESGAEDSVWRALKAKRVTLYNIIVLDNPKEEEKGVQVWSVAHWNMERHLNALAQKPRGGGRVAYAHPETGKSIAFKRQGSGPDNTQYIGHKFEDRDYTIPEELWDTTYTLEDIVHIPTYQEIYNAYYGGQAPPVATPVAMPVDSPEIPAERKQRTITPMRTRQAKPECFGIDAESLDECTNCPDWADCMVAYEINTKNKTTLDETPNVAVESDDQEDSDNEPEPEPVKPTRKLRPSLRQKLND